MSTIESQIQKLNDTNAELARVNNELTSAVRTHTSKINNEVAAAKNTMSAATASAISEVKADANAVNDEIKARMDDAVVPWLPAMTKVQFDALRADRKQQYAGSGFVEWGKHGGSQLSKAVNDGLWTYIHGNYANNLMLGRYDDAIDVVGSSKTEEPIISVDGVLLKLKGVGSEASYHNRISFPQAPDGTKTYDSATGSVTKHTNAEVAFASETATNKVITSRKDLVFLESWHEKIADKDVVYPLGNVQYGASSYEGIALSNNLVAQGYSAFGEWDENTKGYGVKWSSLTDAQKALFLSDPEHNIYFDPQAKAYIQVRYRIRVVEGLGDDWVESITPTNNNYFRYNKYHQSGYVSPQGVGTIAKDFNRSYPVFTSANRSDAALKHDDYLYGAAVSGNKPAEVIAFEGLCFALPIALVQRMNQGAYHPVYNPMGCATFAQSGLGYASKWYQITSNISSQLACFVDFTTGDAGRSQLSGYIGSTHGSGRSDQYKYYDAIYAGQVEDLRLNANKLDVNKLREDSIRKAVAGTLRGKGKVLFTQFKTLNQGYYRFSNQYHASFFNSATDGQLLAMHENEYAAGTSVMVWQPATNTVLYGRISNSNGHIYLTKNLSNLGNKLHTHPLNSTGLVSTEVCYFAQVNYLAPEFDSLPWIDIVGDPERIAATFPDGVVGQWLPKLPDNSSGYPLNRKMTNTVLNASYSRDLGATWANTNVGHNALLNTSSGSWNPEVVALLTYESQANFTELATSSNIVDSRVGDVFVSLSASTNQGNRLHPSLTNKIGKSGVSDPTFKSYSVASSQVMNDKLVYEPKHPLMDVAKPANNSPAVKALPTITEKNGLYYLQLHGAELKHHTPTFTDVNPNANTNFIEGNFYRLTNYGSKGYYVCEVTKTFVLYTNTDYIQMENGDIVHGPTNQVVLRKLNTADGSGWGDDQTIPIVNGEDVKTDLNGNAVKVFCHHTQIPLGIAHND
ncbi:hypothetical protein [Pseudoalteromonas sp. MMG012]|uniref:hypothetical protein n=1 Tax=Pseudoalteromonas sp. MMG012 TaxID=2822686 RepID=UPI001B3A2BA6|nr:hypothetical protein [Pseudoalteromonas sp. MMG012]MBQ4851002.1 hypothetical protein [Pseudoalteromonas sp. MMG012]